MNKLPWFKFFPDDWITGTRELSSEEKAVWIDLLAYMWKAPVRGQITGTWGGIARMTGTEWLACESIITGMATRGILDILTDPNGNITLISRRMKNEENARESNRFRQRKHYSNSKPNANLTDKKSEVRRQTPIVPKGDGRFDAFWKAYPKKIGKGAAEKAWKKVSSLEAVFERIMGAVAVQSGSAQWLKEGGQFIPHPATWLNQKRWEDEIQQTAYQEADSWLQTK